jgi:hypothetical protein
LPRRNAERIMGEVGKGRKSLFMSSGWYFQIVKKSSRVI